MLLFERKTSLKSSLRDAVAKGGVFPDDFTVYASGKSTMKTFSGARLRDAHVGAICARFYVRLLAI
jgi:hypothetical protein